MKFDIFIDLTLNATCCSSYFYFKTLQADLRTIDVSDLPVLRKRVRPINSQGDFESRKLWQHVTNALNVGDVNTATEHKRFVSHRLLWKIICLKSYIVYNA